MIDDNASCTHTRRLLGPKLTYPWQDNTYTHTSGRMGVDNRRSNPGFHSPNSRHITFDTLGRLIATLSP